MCTFMLSLCQPLKFCVISTQISAIILFRKTVILVKTGKITCLLTVNKDLHQLPWVDCTIVEKEKKKKKEF